MDTPDQEAVIGTDGTVPEGRSQKWTACQDCGARLRGPFCSACGQQEGDLHLSVSQFAHEAVDGLFSFDARAWKTILLLLRRPAFLTVEYWQGRRTRYLAPLRTYFFVSFLLFFAQGLLPADATVDRDVDVVGQATAETTSSQAEPEVDDEIDDEIDWDEDFADTGPAVRWMAENLLRPVMEQPERARETFFKRLPLVLFLLVPVFAALLRLLYRKREPFFVPHVVFALHFHAAAFVLLTVETLAELLTGRAVLEDAVELAVVVVLYLSLRRAYGSGRLETLFKQTALLSIHLVVAAVAMIVLAAVTGLSL